MIKRIFALLLVFVLLVALLSASLQSYADPMTVAQIASVAYALGSSWGLNFNFSGMTAVGANGFLQDQINDWLGSESLITKFGSEAARLAAGKLIIPAVMYNGIRQFLENFKDHNTIDSTNKIVSLTTGNMTYSYLGMVVEGSNMQVKYTAINTSTGGVSVINGPGWTNKAIYSGYFKGFSISGNKVKGNFVRTREGANIGTYDTELGYIGSSTSQVGATLDGAIPGSDIGSDLGWEGTFDGAEFLGTLQELIDKIDQDTVAGDLDVTGEIVEPAPVPTPAPTVAPDTPLAEAPYSGLTDAIGTQTGEITGSIEGVQEGVAGLTEALEEATTVPSPEAASEFQWDLKQLFPFCIPFDIANMYQAFDGAATAPNIQIPIVIPSFGFSYTLQLDFSPFNGVAAILRQVELIAFGLALAWGTSKVIRW